MNKKEMERELKEYFNNGGWTDPVGYFTFNLYEKEEDKVNNIKSGNYGKYRAKVIHGKELYKIKEIMDYSHATILHLDKEGNFYLEYYHNYRAEDSCLAPIEKESTCVILRYLTKSYCHDEPYHERAKGCVIKIEYATRDVLKDIKGRIIEVGDTVIAAKCAWDSQAPELFEGKVVSIKNTEVDLDVEKHVKSKLYLVEKGKKEK